MTSPLLKLPSEVRNRIYEHVFGIGILHVGSSSQYHFTDRGAFPKSICCADESEADAARYIRESEDLSSEDLFTTRHYKCHHHADGSGFWKGLNILTVCRQIHREAALLPYKLNTFYFNNIFWIFSVFQRKLAGEQRKEIRSIGFFQESMDAFPAEELKSDDMRNVQNLSVFVHHRHRDSALVAAWLARDDKDSDDLGTGLFNYLKQLDLDLQNVSVTIYPRDKVGNMVSVEAFKQWSIYVEKKLLEINEAKAEHTKDRSRSVNI